MRTSAVYFIKILNMLNINQNIFPLYTGTEYIYLWGRNSIDGYSGYSEALESGALWVVLSEASDSK